MKNLKRTLSLVLALVLAVGLLTVGAGAAFKDDAKIQYKEAVDLLTGLGVINGYPEDNTFRPTENFDRGGLAKMVAYFSWGGKDLSNYYQGSNVFADLDGYGWAKGSINYGYNAGYITGTSATTYNPTGTVKGSELAKTLLVVLGYDPKSTSVQYALEGANWELNAIRIATQIGLYDNLGADFDPTAALTREQAAQIFMNALFLNTVDAYKDDGSPKTINGAPIAKSTYKMSSVVGIVNNNAYDNASAETTTVGSTPMAIKTGEEVYKHYVEAWYKDADGDSDYDSNEAVYAVVDLSTVVEVAANITTNPEALKAAFGAAELADSASSSYDYSTGTADAGTYIIYNGDIKAYIAPVSYEISKVTAYTAPTEAADGKITITHVTDAGAFGSTAEITLKDLKDTTTVDPVVLYDGIAAGDFVYLQKVGTNPMSVTKATVIAGANVASFTPGSPASMVIGGQTYVESAIVDNSVVTNVDNTTVGATLRTFVLDKAGAVAGYTSYTAPSTSTANEYAYILDIDYADGEDPSISNGYTTKYAKATVYLLKADGTKATFTYTSESKTTDDELKSEFGTFAKGDVIKYAADNGVFTEVPSSYTEVESATAIITAKSAITGVAGLYYTSTTPFVYMDTSAVSNNATLVTGYAAAEAATAGEAVVVTDDTTNTVIVVFVENAYVGTPATETNIAVVNDAITNSSYSTTKYDETLKANVYGYDFYVNGVKTTFWAKSGTLSSLSASAGYITYTVTDGYLTAVSNTIAGYTAVNGTVNFVDGANIVLGSTQYVYNSAVNLVTYDTSDAVLTAGGSLVKDAVVTYALKNNTTGAIDYAYITVD